MNAQDMVVIMGIAVAIAGMIFMITMDMNTDWIDKISNKWF